MSFGFDDIPTSKWSTAVLTTLRQSLTEMARWPCRYSSRAAGAVSHASAVCRACRGPRGAPEHRTTGGDLIRGFQTSGRGRIRFCNSVGKPVLVLGALSENEGGHSFNGATGRRKTREPAVGYPTVAVGYGLCQLAGEPWKRLPGGPVTGAS